MTALKARSLFYSSSEAAAVITFGVAVVGSLLGEES